MSFGVLHLKHLDEIAHHAGQRMCIDPQPLQVRQTPAREFLREGVRLTKAVTADRHDPALQPGKAICGCADLLQERRDPHDWRRLLRQHGQCEKEEQPPSGEQWGKCRGRDLMQRTNAYQVSTPRMQRLSPEHSD